MPRREPIILLTRPKKQSAQFRELLGENVDVVESPVIEIKYFSTKIEPDKYSALIFTSQNAIHSVSDKIDLAGRHAFAVGQKTAELARSFGMSVASSDGDADRLVRLIAHAKPSGKLLLVRGKHAAGNIVDKLGNCGLETDSAITYAQEPAGLNSDAIAVLQAQRPVILPLFSARSALILSQAVRDVETKAPLILVAISASVLKAWERPLTAVRLIAKRPIGDDVATEVLRLIGRTS